MPKTIRLFHLGCRVNQYELAAMGELLKQTAHYSVSTTASSPDICILNTCCVTGKAGMQSRQLIRKTIRQFPDAKIIVTGCYAQLEPTVVSEMEGIDGILGNPHKQEIVSFLDDVINSNTIRIRHTQFSPSCVFQEMPPDLSTLRTRPVVKIQDGCNAFCSYCIVPFVRGRSRSLPMPSILQQVEELAANGFAEIVLSGIHLGHYGLDLSPSINLETLLVELASSSILRIRLSSIEPNEITEPMIRLVAQKSKFCRHFHIPLQSGDSTILQKMNRTYTPDLFAEKVTIIRKIIPNAAIGADIIVGFPSETDEMFEKTFSFIKQLPLTYLHVFPFSERPGTIAAQLPNPVSSDVIKARCKRLRALSLEKQQAFLKTCIGQKLGVLLEERWNSDFLKGTTDNYISVLVKGDDSLLQKEVPVKITAIQGRFAIADRVL